MNMDVPVDELPSMVFKQVTRDDLGEFSLNGQMLRVFLEFDGRKNISSVSGNTGLDLAELHDVTRRLLQLNLIEPVAKPVSLADAGFFSFLQNQLALAVGPLASILLDDALADMGHTRERFPINHAAELVDILSEDIQREEKRITFRQNMLNKIRQCRY
jgi:hypothetical protein